MSNRAKVCLSIGCILGLGACAEPTGLPLEVNQPQLAATSEKSTRTLENFVFPFFADCLGEEVVWTGSARFDDHIVTKSDGSVHVNGKGSLLPGNQISSSSGIWLPTKVRSNYVFTLTPTGETRRDMLNERITWQNTNTGAVMDVIFRIHTVYAGNGELKRDVFVDHHCELRR
jgi:hypothetical protein